MRFLFFFLFTFISHLIANDSKPLVFLGATTIQPIIETVQPDYLHDHGINIVTEGGGSDKGVQYLSEHKIDVAMINRFPSEEEKRRYASSVIGYDAVAIIVHKSNPIKALSKQQLTDIFSGKVTRWNRLGGSDKAIIPISKKPGRGTLYLFEKATGLQHSSKHADPSKTIVSSAWEAGANNDNIVLVGGLPEAISYVSFGNAHNAIANGMPIKILPLDGVDPSEKSIHDHTYPIIGELTLLYHKNNERARQFITYILSEKGQRSVEQNKFSRVTHGK